ncbi:hypothetical protein OBBRIDRAFT_887807 [Obba rivulosa]|uniref:DNA polymerase V n=1 Tax=Obba rivulosa TaxID=1052685 RepID=A0A8E2ASR1_9APHY|nr:hypothetical protein OBBRIDRAFT_887807 [Obba rivulosa]
MSTTLPLFWHLSSANKKERLDASVKLVSALEHFQSQFVPKLVQEESEDEGEDADAAKTGGLDALNAQDVSYSIRRLIRGLASPRESSRLGFAVALTELLSRIDTVTCSQIVALIIDFSKTHGSMTGQEERDVFFARLFGLTSVIQSGLLLRETPLPTSASSSTLASSLASYKDVLAHLLALGEKKSWLRESAWFSLNLAIDALGRSQIAWRAEAIDATIQAVYVESKGWTPEKIAVTLKLQELAPEQDWRKLLAPTFKHPELLSTGNLATLAKILKESTAHEGEESDVPKVGGWKPQVHFVWDMLLDQLLPDPDSGRTPKGSFPEFFRIVVDESLFATTSSPERKYWGFQIFQKALPRASVVDMPMLFTRNFMRSWINHLSNSDRYLHKIARQVAADVQSIVKQNPTLGFTLILQLTGVHGSRQFDKLTKTKTVEAILTSMDKDGIQSYIDYLLGQVDDQQDSEKSDIQAVNARRAWVIDQLTALVRNGAIPKDDTWIRSILDWFVLHGLFIAKKKSEKSPIAALRSVPTPAFSDELRKSCRERLLSCLADLTGQTTVLKGDSKTLKSSAVAADGEFWISKVLATIEQLEKDTKHVTPLNEADEEEQELRPKARQLIERLGSVSGEQQEAAKGTQLLLSATLLHQYCADEEDSDPDALDNCISGAERMFPVEVKKKSKKSRKSTGGDEQSEAEPEPVDVLVDTVIGFLEKATAYMRAVANQVFSLLSGSVQESTIDLILTQLERRTPEELAANEDESMDDEEASDDEEAEEAEDNEESSSESDEEEEEADEEEDLELRRKIEEALRVNGVEAATGDSDEESEELMDDDQMIALDEQLAAAFRSRANEKKLGKDVDAQREATHFKNRVLDLIDTFLKKQQASPLVLRVLLPLTDLILGTGRDEKQLADKATGILRSRVGKSKDVPSNIDAEVATEVLKELHSRARKAPSADVISTLGQCSAFLARSLFHAGSEEPVLDIYRESLADFVTRKASRLNSAFFQEFIRRHPDAAWGLRSDLVELTGKAVNVYRQCQTFHLLQTLLNQVHPTDARRTEILDFMTTLRRTLLSVMQKACEGEATLNTAQIKELLKLGLQAIRQTKRLTPSSDELASVWDPSAWNSLKNKLSASERFKSSTGLHAMSKQMAQAAGQDAETKGKGASATKRKAEEIGEEGEAVATPSKAKRKKVKKSKA